MLCWSQTREINSSSSDVCQYVELVWLTVLLSEILLAGWLARRCCTIEEEEACLFVS